MISSGLIDALVFLINAVFVLYTGAVMLRFLLQWVRASFHNPLAQAIVTITNPLLLPLRRVVPGWRNLDVAALVLMVAVQLINIALTLLLIGIRITPLYLLEWTLLKLAIILVNLYFFSILLEALLSWINPGRYDPMSSLLRPLNAPLLRPVRRVLPLFGGLDLSPLVVMLLLQAVNIVLSSIPLSG
jgi:YggT family protein